MTASTPGVRKLSVGPTLSDQAYVALRQGITTGEFAAGQRLTERELAEHLGVSPTPVREALRRLEHERLIERDAARLIRVADPSTARLYELTLIEAALRGVAARLAAERATDAEAAAIEEACDRAEAMLAAPDLEGQADDLLVLTRQFHAMVDEASNNRTLIDMIATATAFDFAFRRKWSTRVHRDRNTVAARLDQHRAIATAIRARDGDSAEQTMRTHITEGSRAFLEIAARPATVF